MRRALPRTRASSASLIASFVPDTMDGKRKHMQGQCWCKGQKAARAVKDWPGRSAWLRVILEAQHGWALKPLNIGATHAMVVLCRCHRNQRDYGHGCARTCSGPFLTRSFPPAAPDMLTVESWR